LTFSKPTSDRNHDVSRYPEIRFEKLKFNDGTKGSREIRAPIAEARQGRAQLASF